MSVEQLVVQYGIAGAVLVCVWWFLRHLEKKAKGDAAERQAEREDRAAARKEFEETIRGIADKHTTAIDNNTKIVQKLTRRVEHCPQRKNGLTHPIEDDEGGTS